MLQVLGSAGVLNVEVIVVRCYPLRGDAPGAFVLAAVMPPFEAGLELLELQGLGLGVVLAALGERVLEVPDLFGGAGAIEEEEVRGNTRIWREDTVG